MFYHILPLIVSSSFWFVSVASLHEYVISLFLNTNCLEFLNIRITIEIPSLAIPFSAMLKLNGSKDHEGMLFAQNIGHNMTHHGQNHG